MKINSPFIALLVTFSTTSALAQELKIPEMCKDPAQSQKACAIAPLLYESLLDCDAAVRKLKIDKTKLTSQLHLAEDKLLELQSIPEPTGITLPTWLLVTLPIVAAGAGIGATILITK